MNPTCCKIFPPPCSSQQWVLIREDLTPQLSWKYFSSSSSSSHNIHLPESVPVSGVYECQELPHLRVQGHVLRLAQHGHLHLQFINVKCNHLSCFQLTCFIILVTNFLKVMLMISLWTPSFVPDPTHTQWMVKFKPLKNHYLMFHQNYLSIQVDLDQAP